jgi:serine/threonine protein kinase
MGCANSSDIRTRKVSAANTPSQKPKITQRKNTAGVGIKSKYLINPKILGTGKTSTVYSASKRENPEEKVAIKVINKIKINQQLEKVMSEIDILKSLDHAHIVKYVEFYENEYNVYLVMENCTGGELHQVIQRKVRNNHGFSESEACRIVTKILEALKYCHSKGVTHGDLKPSDVMFDREGIVKLVDFGTKFEAVSNSITSHYKAPELKSGNEPCPKSDIWACGVLLYVSCKANNTKIGHATGTLPIP